MKHVWMLNHYAPKPDSQGGMRHLSLARHLRRHGWSTTIIAADTHIGGDQPDERLTHDGVSFVWLPARPYVGNGTGRILNMLDYTRAVLRRGALSGLEAPDVIIGSSVHPLAAWAGRRLARRHRVPFVFEVRDLWPQTLIDMGRISHGHPAAVALRWLEKSLYRSAARIIVLLPRAGDYIEPLGIEPEKIVWIPNGVALDRFPANPPKVPSENFTLMYFGAHGEANGLDNLLEAMRLLSEVHGRHDIVLRLIGDGPLKPSLQASARSMGLANVRFEDPVPKARIPAIAAEADAFVICVRNLPKLYRYGISMNKLYDYLAAGRPTIISVSAANNPVAEADAGITVPPEDPQALAAAIVEMASLPKVRLEEMGQAGRRHVDENFDMGRLAARLASVLDDCLRTG